MTRLKTSSGQFGLIGGICRASSDCILAEEPSPASPVARWKGNMYILAEPVMEGGRGYQVAHQVIVDISQAYYACSAPGITTCLARAIQQGNRTLFQHNMEVSAHEKITIGVTCAVVRREELFVAQVLPSQTYVVHKGRIQSFPLSPSWDPEAATLPTMARLLALGWAEDIAPEFFHSSLQAGDVFCLCTSNIGRFLGKEEAEQVLLYQEPGDVVEQLYRRVHQQSFQEAHAVVVEMQPAVSRAAASFFSLAGLKERARLAGESVAAWGSFLGGETRRLLPRRKAAGRRPKRRPRPQPAPATPPPVIPPPARARPLPWYKTLFRRVYNIYHPQVGYPRLERPRLRIPPAKRRRRIAPFLLGLASLAVLIVIIVLVARGCQENYKLKLTQLLDAAQQEINAAAKVSSVADANRRLPGGEQDFAAIAEANRRLDETEKTLSEALTTYNKDPQVELRLRDLQDEQDRLNSVTRFGKLDLLVDLNAMSTTMATSFPQGCAGDCLFSDMVMINDTLYLLEGSNGTVYAYATTSNDIIPILGPGVLFQDCLGRSRESGPVLDLTILTRAGACVPDQPEASWLAAVDTSQVLYLFHGGEWETYQLFSRSGWQSRTVAIDLENWLGNLYVLNGEPNQILKYYRNAYEVQPENRLRDVSGVQTASIVDMAIDGRIFLLLKEDGKIQVVEEGAAVRNITYRVYPPTVFPSQVSVDQQNLEGPFLYVADRYGRIIQLHKEGKPAFVRQLMGPEDGDLRELAAVVVREKQGREQLDTFYLVTGSKLYRGVVAPPLGEALPMAVPSPSPQPD